MTNKQDLNIGLGEMPKNKAKCRNFEVWQFEKSPEIWYNTDIRKAKRQVVRQDESE